MILAIPYDLAQAKPLEGEMKLVAETTPVDSQFEDSEVTDGANQLLRAKRPLLLAGRGARDAQRQRHGLADKIGAPIVSSALAHGTFA